MITYEHYDYIWLITYLDFNIISFFKLKKYEQINKMFAFVHTYYELKPMKVMHKMFSV